jgi:hypothetical protein
VTNLDDYLYDIDRRPPNWELRFFIGFQVAICGAIGGGAPLFLLHWAGVRQWTLIGMTLLGAAFCVWRSLRYFKRRGAKVKAEYMAHGGNPAGTSDLLFGQVIYKITPEGRWKWPEPSSNSE